MIFTVDKLTEMERWREKNGATLVDTAKHFGLNPGSYKLARSGRLNEIGSRRLQPKIKWTTDKLLEMERWKRDRKVSAETAAKHFGVPYKAYVLARQRHLVDTGLAKPVTGAVAKAPSKATKIAKTEVIDLQVDDVGLTKTKEQPIVMLVIQPKQLTEVLGDLWR